MEKKEFTSHVSGSFNRALEELFNQVLEMGGLVERQLASAIHAVQNYDIQEAREVINLDKLVNQQEIEIDRLSVRLLARQQPTASDLRLVIASIRLGVDLERMGDEVVKIANMVIQIAKMDDGRCQGLEGYKQLIEIASRATEMLQKALNAFARLDIKDCSSIIEEEERVDELFKVTTDEVMALFKDSDVDVVCLFELIYALRASERITDHARNMAETIIYLVNGQEMRNIDPNRLAEFLENIS
ncbi:phosphate signaling complex protein PhoU [Thiomicrospira sp. ALE5]|uniref:phosphate signaling complex protein PhoU n=1 Tax=Thiomicrospira sp. ALE5 TaxID=748650 RepID=UPI0008EFAF41|nr:phosphate signaling complex protein PhoU [Thiomicrospira sp. ALE5]SFR53766.1 phosphate transport system protein [Thiomicrospira sp. ALE5]